MESYVEPSGLPDQSIWKTLSVSFIFTPFILALTYECTKVTASSDKTYAWSFAGSRSWEIQSTALESSIRIVPTKFLLSHGFF